MTANGEVQCVRAMDFRYVKLTYILKGLMELNIKDSGRIIKLLDKENFGMLMEMYSMGSGEMIKLMALVHIYM